MIALDKFIRDQNLHLKWSNDAVIDNVHLCAGTLWETLYGRWQRRFSVVSLISVNCKSWFAAEIHLIRLPIVNFTIYNVLTKGLTHLNNDWYWKIHSRLQRHWPRKLRPWQSGFALKFKWKIKDKLACYQQEEPRSSFVGVACLFLLLDVPILT